MLRVFAALLSFLILSTTTPVFSQVPNLVNFQASLNEANGDPISGERSIRFSLYPASDSDESAFVWRETQTVQVVDGLYVVQLGSVTTFQGGLFSAAELWLGVKVGTDAEQTPRIRTIAVPYALYSQRSEKAAAVDDGVIGSEQVANESIQSEDLTDGTIVNSDLAPGDFSSITGVGDLGALTVTGAINAGDIVTAGPVLDVRAFDGADVGAKISAAITAAPNGAVISALGLTGAQAISTKIIVNKPVTILLAGATYTFSGSDAVFEITSDSVSIIGSGRGESSLDSGPTQIFLPSGNTSKHLIGADINLLQLKNLTFLGPGIDEPTGGGIDLELTGGGNINGLIFENILVHNIAATGISIDVPIMSSFRNVRVVLCAVHGINIKGGTSINFDSVFVSTVVQSGIQLTSTSYSTFQNTAVETAGIGYNIKSSFNITLVSPGAESQLNRSTDFNGIAYKIDGGKYINLISPYSRDVPATGSYHFVVEGAENVIITNPRVKQGTVTPTDDILINAMSKNVELVTNIDASRIDDSGTNTLIRYGKEFNGLEVSGNIGVGVDEPTERVEVNGTVKATAFDGDGANVVNLSIATSEIETDAVTNPKIATDAVDTAQIADAAVTTDKIDSGAVTEAKIASDAVTTVKISDANVTEAKLATDAVTTIKIANANVTTDKLAASAVTTAKIADANVTNAKLSSNAVTTVKISDANVTEDKLASDSVTTAKIADANVTTDKLAASAVTTAKIADDSITTDKMAPSLSGVPVGGIVYSRLDNDATLLANGYSVLSKVEVNPSDAWESMSETNAPSVRNRHAMIWTGDKVLIWGGADTSGAKLNTGAVYNPTDNTWSPISTTDAPSARADHTAVWTGSEMLIWAGLDGSGVSVNTGGRYDPSTDTWVSMTGTSAPDGRYRHTAIWTGDKMIVFGGESHVGVKRSALAIYDPHQDSWTGNIQLSGEPSARSFHTAIWTGEKMIIWGGSDSSDVRQNDIHSYDPTANSWATFSTSDAPDGRGEHSVVWTGEKMIVFGGLDGNDTFHSGGIFTPQTSTWTPTSLIYAPEPRESHTGVWTGSKVIIWGGRNGPSFNTGGIYDPVTDLWEETASVDAPQPRAFHTAIWTGTKMIVWGGLGPEAWGSWGESGSNTTLANGAIYNPANDVKEYFLYLKQ